MDTICKGCDIIIEECECTNEDVYKMMSEKKISLLGVDNLFTDIKKTI